MRSVGSGTAFRSPGHSPRQADLATGQAAAGVNRRGADASPAFIEAASPTDDELHALLQPVIERLMKLLTRRGVLVEDMGQTYLADPDADGEAARTLRPLQAPAVAYLSGHAPGRRC
jgi:hypothetical protein